MMGAMRWLFVLVATIGCADEAGRVFSSGLPECKDIITEDATKADITCNDGGLCDFRGEACCVDVCAIPSREPCRPDPKCR
jgi:hypothetical protein